MIGVKITYAGRLAQLVRASRSHREGHPFKSDIAHLKGKVLSQIEKTQEIKYKDKLHHIRCNFHFYKKMEEKC